jgi:hypothetical protein
MRPAIPMIALAMVAGCGADPLGGGAGADRAGARRDATAAGEKARAEEFAREVEARLGNAAVELPAAAEPGPGG